MKRFLLLYLDGIHTATRNWGTRALDVKLAILAALAALVALAK
jgi:hypothetical protein